MRKSKWIARMLAIALTINTASGYVPPTQSAQAAESSVTAQEKTQKGNKISLNPTGGGFISEPELFVEPGKSYGTLPTPVRVGYDFLGWFTEENGGVRVDETTVAAFPTLYAHWKPLSIRIDLYANGGELSETEILVNFRETYNILPTPKKAGYQFLGWFTAYDGGEKVNLSDQVTVTSAIPLYAHWGGTKVNLSFQAEGVEIPEKTVEYGMAYGTLPEVQKEGYLFDGWYTSAQGGEKISETTPVKTQTAHTLYAQWTEVEAKATLELEGGECDISEIPIYPGTLIGTLPTPEKTGYLFLGWFAKNGEKEIQVTETTRYTPSLGTVFYAKWEGIQLNLTLQPLTEEGEKQVLEVIYGEPYPPLPELRKEHYDFSGWFTKISGGEKIETDTVVKLKTDTTLYARWEGKEYTVSFNANGGTVSKDNIPFIYGTPYGTLPTPTRTGYRFDGWYNGTEDGAEKITKNDTVSLTKDVTFYAHWTPKKPEITFYANGGTMYFHGTQGSSCTVSYNYDSPYGELPVPKQEGYTFEGWFTAKTGGEQVFSSTLMRFSSASSLYAHWRGNEYLVTLNAQEGTLSQKTCSVTFGEKYGDLPVPTKQNYTFTGWKLGEEFGGTSITATTSVKTAQNHTLYANYRGKAIKLLYDNNGGTEGSSSSKTVYYGEAAGTLRTPSRSGYEFLGWFTNGKQITEDTIITLIADATIRAEWQKKGYTVTFDANGGVCDTDTRIYSYGEVYGPLPVPVRAGYTFLGWFTSATSGTQKNDTDTVKLNSNIRLYAHWKGKSATITFDLNGGTATTQSKEVTYGSTYGTLPTPKRTGFTFAGWFTQKQYGYKVTSSSHVEVEGNHVLYACWKQETFIITFEANGGTVAYHYIGIPVGIEYSSFPTPTKPGYVFDGWYTSSTSGTKITHLTETDTLYAHWKPNTYRVDFNSCGGTNCGSITVTYTKTYGTLPTPTKPGLSFAGWYTEPDGGTKVSASTSMKKAYDHTLYAHWTGITSTLSYDANGGNSVTKTKSITSGEAYGTLASTSWTGHKFLGWYTAKDGGTQITAESIVTVIQNQKLYAHWEVLRPTIRFTANGGGITTTDGTVGTLEVAYTYGQKYNSFPKVSKTGYRFIGWFTGQTGGTQVTEETVCEITTSDTFYAHWEGIQNTVQFDANDGVLNASPITVVYGEVYGTLPTPSRFGYTFSGWFTEKEAGEKITTSSKAEILSSQTLYAQWEKKTYKVTLDGNGGSSVITGSDGQPSSVSTRTLSTTYGGTYGGSAGKFPLFTRTGYELLGFFTEETGGEEITAQSSFMREENQTIYAHWMPKNIVVSFYEDGGSPVGEVKRIAYQTAYGTLPTPTKAGYIFNGWKTSKSSTNLITANTIMKKTDGHTLYADWTATEYTLVFDSAGGEPTSSTKTVAMGASIGTLPKVTKENEKLSGWYTKPAGGIAIKTSTKLNVPGDKRYYAHWAKAEIEVKLLSGGKALALKTLLKGDCYGDLPAAEKEGYDFSGWYTKSTGGNEVTATDHCNETEDLSLYAQFKAKTPTLLFYANGGNLAQASKVVTYKEAYGELPTPTLANYVFTGWYTEPEGGTKITETTKVPFTDTTTCYARFKPASLSVTFDAGEGNCTVDKKNLTYEKPYGELPTPTRDGYFFMGWFTQADGGELVQESTLVRNPESHTLYAHWDKVRMLLIFDAGEGNCTITSKALAAGEAYGELPVATRTGYRFTGWYTDALEGEQVGEDTLFKGEKNITVYAHWEAEHYIVTFHPMGGTCSEEQREVVFGEPYGELPTTEYEGFHFIDWYLEIEGQNRITAESKVETAGDHTLYAYYLKEEKETNAPIRAFHFGEPGVNPITGNVSFSVTDMVIAIPGIQYEITRTYNSQNDADSILGRGWSFGFDAKCEVYSDGVIASFPDGSSDTFWKQPDGSYLSKYSRRTATWDKDDLFVVVEPNQDRYYFKQDGKLAHIEDRYGNRTEVSYTDGKISELVDAAGRSYKLTVNSDGKLTKLTDPMGHEVVYAYDKKGYLAAVTNVLGGTTTYTYDEEGYLTQILDPEGIQVQSFDYHGNERTVGGMADVRPAMFATPQGITMKTLSGKTNSVEAKISEDKSIDGQEETKTGARNAQDTVENNPPKTTDIQVTTCIDAYGGTKTYAYDPDKKQTLVTSLDGREWTYWYNSDMYLTAVKNPDGSMEKTEYAPQKEGFHYADVISTTDEYGSKTSYILDENGNITQTTYADGSIQKMWYDAWNNCVIECSQTNIYTYHVYDDKGISLLKNVRRTDGAAITGVTEKNLNEKLKNITCADADYIVEEYRYYTDKEAEEKFHSKLRGLLAETTNPEGEKQLYAYDAYGNATAVTDAAGNTYTYTYDPLGHRLSETTARGDHYSWEYLPNGYVTREHYPDGGTAVSLYDKSGHLLQTVNPEQYEPDKDTNKTYTGTGGTLYEYSVNGRLLSTTDALGEVTNYTYDTNGNVIEEYHSSTESIYFAYDERDRIVSQCYQETTSAGVHVFEEYDYETLKNGERKVTARRYLDIDEVITQVTIYDAMGRQKEVYLLVDGKKTMCKEYTYYPDGALHTMTENGVTTTWQYDAQGNTISCEEPFQKENEIVSYMRTENRYDRAGRLIEASVSELGETTKATTYYHYENGRLLEEISPAGIHTYYTYDADDNVIRTQIGNGTVQENTAQITEATHDFRGNLLTETTWVREEDLADSPALSAQGFLSAQETGAKIAQRAGKNLQNQPENEGLCALTTTLEYDLGGRLTKETSPDGVITLHSYDAAGNELTTEIKTSDGTLVTNTKKEYNSRGEMIAETNALGAVTKYTYDHRGNLIQMEDALGGISLFTYNYNDQKTAEVSPANYRLGKKLREMARTEYTYDAAGRISTRTDYEFDEAKIHSSDWPQGFHSRISETYTYDNAGNTTQIRDAEGNGAIYTYHPNGLVATSKTAAEQAKMEGIALSYSYDIFGNTVGLRAGEYEHRYRYDPEGRLLSESDNYGTIKTCTYDALGRLQTETDGVGATTYSAYNALGEISWQKLPGDETVPELEIFYKYDRAGRLAESEDSLGVRITYTYDALGNLLTQTTYDPETKESLTISYTYDALGHCTSVTDASGIYTKYHYDALGRKISESLYTAGKNAEPKTTEWEYDADGRNTLTRDFLGNETRTTYDSLGRVNVEYDAFNYPVLIYQYNDCDRQISSTDALGNKTTYAYDGDGNVITSTTPDGAITRYTYDYAGNQISKTDPKGNQTRYVYDGRNRLISVVNALGEAYTYRYDNADRQTEQIDPAGKGILYTYNVRGDLATRNYLGEEAQETYRYTAKGNLFEKTSRNGVVTTYTYDGFGRLLTERAGTDQKTYTYDKAGNLLTATANDITTTRTYDAEGRVTSKTVDGIGTMRYLYDLDPENGSVSEQSIAPDGVTKETRYDKAGRIAFVDSSDGTSGSESYYKNGSRKANSTDRGIQEYRYDAAGRVIKLSHKNAKGWETEVYSYVYDANGNLTEEESSRGTIQYTYDALDRLISVIEPEGKITWYTYDASGNRATKKEWDAGRIIQTSYTYDAANLLIKQESDDGSTILYTYDENGNLVQEETTNREAQKEMVNKQPEETMDKKFQEESLALFSYEELELITGSAVGTELPDFFPGVQETVTGSTITPDTSPLFPGVQGTVTGSTIQPETPALSPEVQETVTGGAISETISGSAIRCYTYDNFNRLISYQSGDTLAFYTYDAEDYRITKQVMDSDGEKFTRYFYEGNHVVLEADESGKITAHNTYSIHLIGRTVGEEGYYYFYNAHGDVVKLIGIQSEEEILYRYDAFGTLVEVTGDADNSITYAGYQYDKESGLYYLNARYYDSTTARFLTEDTFAGKANDPLSLHRYTYCANNPLRYTDPDGHFFGALFRFVAGAVVGAVTEYVTQKFIEKRDKINVKAIVYEGVVGGVTSVIGGVGGAAKKAEKTVKAVKSAKTVVKSAVKTGVKEAAGEFLHDVGYQVFAEDKSLADVDYGQAIKAGADSGISAMVGELDDAFGSKKQLSATNRKKASQATGLIDDAADAPRPRTNALPDVEVTPSRGAVKNAAGGLADAGVGTGNIGRKSTTTTALPKDKLKNAKKSSPSLSKNQQKMQSQTVGSALSGIGTTNTSGKRLIPGTKGIVTGGSSTKLGKNMMESMNLPRKTTWTGYQAQHIIPREMSKHPVLKKIGMDLDDASNGLFLRKPADNVSTMSRHKGYHSVYNNFVKIQLDGMDITQSVNVLQKQVYDLQQKLKHLQLSGLPLYPKQRATIDLWTRSLKKIK